MKSIVWVGGTMSCQRRWSCQIHSVTDIERPWTNWDFLNGRIKRKHKYFCLLKVIAHLVLCRVNGRSWEHCQFLRGHRKSLTKAFTMVWLVLQAQRSLRKSRKTFYSVSIAEHCKHRGLWSLGPSTPWALFESLPHVFPLSGNLTIFSRCNPFYPYLGLR